MPNIKSLSVMAQKLWPMLKLSSNKQTDKQTNRRGKNNMPPRSCLGGIKSEKRSDFNFIYDVMGKKENRE